MNVKIAFLLGVIFTIVIYRFWKWSLKQQLKLNKLIDLRYYIVFKPSGALPARFSSSIAIIPLY